jgi:hypothetical protein
MRLTEEFMSVRSTSARDTGKALQAECRKLVQRLGYKVDVDGSDKRLHEALDGKDRARKLRGWCGPYRGDQKSYNGHAPVDEAELRRTFEMLFDAAVMPLDRRDYDAHLVRICHQIRQRTVGPARHAIIARTDYEGITSALRRLLAAAWQVGQHARLQVVTSQGQSHATTAGCLASMMESLHADTERRPTHVRIIEQGAQIRTLPASTQPAFHVKAEVGLLGDERPMSFHGSMVSCIKQPGRDAAGDSREGDLPIGAIIFWKGNYFLREVAEGDPNAERELVEKLADFEAAWTRIDTGRIRRWAA